MHNGAPPKNTSMTRDDANKLLDSEYSLEEFMKKKNEMGSGVDKLLAAACSLETEEFTKITKDLENNEEEWLFTAAQAARCGINYPRDLTFAIGCYQKIAHSFDNPIAYNNLACIYFEGKAIEHDLKKAFECLTKAANKNLKEAVNNLGVFYFKGYGVEQNFEKAFECFQKAEKLGDKYAIYHLGHCYDTGLGVPRDTKKALEYYQLAANKNVREAFNILSLAYEIGLYDLKIDINKSDKYFQKYLDFERQNSEDAFSGKDIKYLPVNLVEYDSMFASKPELNAISLSIYDYRVFVRSCNLMNKSEDVRKIYKAAFEGDIKTLNECFEELVLIKHTLDTSMKALNVAEELNSLADNPLLSENENLLIVAILGNNANIVKRLLELNFDPNKGYFTLLTRKISCLGLAFTFNNFKVFNDCNIINMLKDAKAEFRPKNSVPSEEIEQSMFFQLFFAIRQENELLIKVLLYAGVSIQFLDKNGKTPLMYAARCGNTRVLKLLMENEAEINCFDHKDRSAIMYTCLNGNSGCLNELLSSPRLIANKLIDNFDESNFSPFGYVIENGNTELLKIFLKQKDFAENPFVHAKSIQESIFYPGTSQYEHLLNSPISESDARTVKSQSEAIGVNPIVIYSQMSSLRLAVEKNNSEIVNLLLQAYSTSKLTSLETRGEPQDKSPLMVACENGHLKMVQSLVEAGAALNSQCKQGKTALHYIAESLPADSSYAIVKYLLKQGLDFTIKDNRNLSPLVLASLQREKYFVYSDVKNEKDLGLIKYVRANQIFGCLLTAKFCSQIESGLSSGIIKSTELVKLEKEQIFAFASSLHYALLYLNPKISMKESILIPITCFNEKIISKEIRKRIGKTIQLKNSVLEKIINEIFENYKDDILSGQLLNIDQNKLLKIIWGCSIEKNNFQKSVFDKKQAIEEDKLKKKKREIDDKLFLMHDKLKKYFNEHLKVNVCRQNIKIIMQNIKELSESMAPEFSDIGDKKLKKSEYLLLEVSSVSDKLIEQELSFNCAYKKLSPQIKKFLDDSDLKLASKLLKRLENIKTRIEMHGEHFKQSYQLLKDLELELQEKVKKEKYIRNIQQQRSGNKNIKEDEYIQNCIQKLIEAENRLKDIQNACQKRVPNKNKSEKLKAKKMNEMQKSERQKNASLKKATQQSRQSFKKVKSEFSQDNVSNEEELLALARDKEVKKIIEQQKQKQQRKNVKSPVKSDELNELQKIREREIKKIVEQQKQRELKSEKMESLTLNFDASKEKKIKMDSVNSNLMTDFMSFVDEQSNELQNIQDHLNSNNRLLEKEDNDSLSLTSKSDVFTKHKRENQIQLGNFDLLHKLKARDELTKLNELMQVIITTTNPTEKCENYCKLERAAIMGIVARAMECYKNISATNYQSYGRKNNFFKTLAKVFRDVAFHAFDEKLFKKPSEDIKKNAEINRPFIDMACKLLAFLNDPKWTKQGMTKEDILLAFKGKGQENDLFTKIINLPLDKQPTANACKEQILLGLSEITEFEKLKGVVPDLMLQAACGFCSARIGTFAAELIKKPIHTEEAKLYRKIFNELRLKHKIPLGQYIQYGVSFRHVLKNISDYKLRATKI